MTVRYILAAAFTLASAGCATTEAVDDPAQPGVGLTAGLTSAEQAAYEQCLRDHMAVATSWSMIEENCRDSVTGGPEPFEQW